MTDPLPITIERLGPRHVPDTVALLDVDPVMHVYLHALVLRDVLARPRDEWWGAFRAGKLVALLYLGAWSGAVLPAGEDLGALRALGEAATRRVSLLPPRYQVIGPRAAVAAVREHFPGPDVPPRLERDQRYLVLEPEALPPFERLPELRAARREDYTLVYETGAALRAEELLEDPREVDPTTYARRAEEDCRDGFTWVWRDARGLVFRASVSARTPFAAQVAGVYTLPAVRNQGVARRGLAEMCARLFERAPAVCLFVNDINAPALSLYARLGFVERARWSSAFFAPAPPTAPTA